MASGVKRKRRLDDDLPVKMEEVRREKRPTLSRDERENIAKLLEEEPEVRVISNFLFVNMTVFMNISKLLWMYSISIISTILRGNL